MKPYHYALAALMLVTGSINTISVKFVVDAGVIAHLSSSCPGTVRFIPGAFDSAVIFDIRLLVYMLSRWY